MTAGSNPAAQTVVLQGTATVPTYVTDQSSLDFGSLSVGGGVTFPIQLTNTGMLTLPITGISITGTNAGQFSQVNNCGSALPAGASCTISATFWPTSIGNKSANLRLAFGGGAATPALLPLTGQGH